MIFAGTVRIIFAGTVKILLAIRSTYLMAAIRIIY